MKGTEYAVADSRWELANRLEKAAHRQLEEEIGWIELRRRSWQALLDSLRETLDVSQCRVILDMGSGIAPIFLALKHGEKFAVDPIYGHIFSNYPSLRRVEEFKDVHFINSSIEDLESDKKFDLIFSINMLDHTADLERVADKIDSLLVPGGMFVLTIDCYDHSAIRNIVRFFDVDLPHPHHFMQSDIEALFKRFRLIRKERNLNIATPSEQKGSRERIKIYRVDRLIARAWRHMAEYGKGRNPLFIIKYSLCYALASLVALLTVRPVSSIYPFKKDWLFVYQKGTN